MEIICIQGEIAKLLSNTDHVSYNLLLENIWYFLNHFFWHVQYICNDILYNTLKCNKIKFLKLKRRDLFYARFDEITMDARQRINSN